MFKYFITFCLVVSSFLSNAQSLKFRNGGFNTGLSLNFGATLNRIGLYFGSFYYYDFIQVNTSFRVFYNMKTFGPSIRGFELQPSAGIVCGYGEKTVEEQKLYTVISNQTQRKYAVGYAYNFYFDQGMTSQPSGTILIGINNFELITENDILGKPSSDRFRTGAIKVTYVYRNMLFGISTILWTGNPQSPNSKRINNSEFPSRFGYVDFSEAPYGKFSHGILAIQYKYALDFGQQYKFL